MRAPLFYEEHQKLGEEIQATQKRLVAHYVKISSRYGKASKAARSARRAVKAIDALRCEMDSRACAESPMALYPERAPDRCYYGKGTLLC